VARPRARLTVLGDEELTTRVAAGWPAAHVGRQRGAKVARIDLARKLAEAIWHILTKNEPFAPAGPTMLLVA